MKELNEMQRDLLLRATEEIRPEYIAEASSSLGMAKTARSSSPARKAVLRAVCIAAAAVLILGGVVFASVRGIQHRIRYGEQTTEGEDIRHPSSQGLVPPGENPWKDSLDILDCGGEYVAYRLALEGGVPYMRKAEDAFSYTLDEDGIIQDMLKVTIRDGFVSVEYPAEDPESTRAAVYSQSLLEENTDRLVPVGTSEAGEPLVPSLTDKIFRDYRCTYGELYVMPDALYFDLGGHWGTVELRQISVFPRTEETTAVRSDFLLDEWREELLNYLIRKENVRSEDELNPIYEEYAETIKNAWNTVKSETEIPESSLSESRMAAFKCTLYELCDKNPVLVLVAVYNEWGDNPIDGEIINDIIWYYLQSVNIAPVDYEREGPPAYDAIQMAVSIVRAENAAASAVSVP